ncbi:hypothetical protein PP175_25705 (plasmid) [Aneurinibacillus sp. Ricciae_BoGa-3]|uniref:hypothetical protein n=1 Tax=Aneurinibacillus sp. Ricciae_BoGa-3 TaxID=3022697 RepID=UPI00234087AD|nr:hypothetical protein [Aneurinibacillus sp. Ricciae_BoGa-3]WCK57465.1 hypothetical protein PP175_25705 [Aneurinibacillus sp. Ricciae_BoGa-3]
MDDNLITVFLNPISYKNYQNGDTVLASTEQLEEHDIAYCIPKKQVHEQMYEGVLVKIEGADFERNKDSYR